MNLDALRWMGGPVLYLLVWSTFVVVALVQLGRLPVEGAPHRELSSMETVVCRADPPAQRARSTTVERALAR